MFYNLLFKMGIIKKKIYNSEKKIRNSLIKIKIWKLIIFCKNINIKRIKPCIKGKLF
jgi:hypothetical protein